MEEEFYKKLKEKVRKIVEDKGGHDFSHIERVYNFAIEISEGLDLDLDVIKVSALLHDIAKEKEMNGNVKDHAEQGAIEAKKILEEMEFPEDKMEYVYKCIKFHNKPDNNSPIDEVRVLNEADGLEGIGAVGIIRGFLFLGPKIVLYDPAEKSKSVISFLKSFSNSNFFKIPKAKKIAGERIKFMKNFNKQFIREWNQEDLYNGKEKNRN